jgi:predicted membrane GTPase involved in stress response
MTMQLNKIHSVKTIDRVAAGLGKTVDRIFDLAIDMETEDGVIWVYGPGNDSVIAFTPFGIENLRELIEMDRQHAR